MSPRRRSSANEKANGSGNNRRFLALMAFVVVCEILRNMSSANQSLAALTVYMEQQQPAGESSVRNVHLRAGDHQDNVTASTSSSSTHWWGSMGGTPQTPASGWRSDGSVVPSSTTPQIAKPHVCGVPWDSFLQGLTFDNAHGPLLWTVSGGDEYRQYVGMLLDHWALRVEPSLPVLVVALDAATARRVCDLGYMAVYWDADVQSYSRVADAKFQASAEWAERGIDALFIELDVFCRSSPVPLLLDYQAKDDTDLVVIGHGDLNAKINIGVYYVKANAKTALFFRNLAKLLEPSLTVKSYMKSGDNAGGFFDQDVFSSCIRYTGGGWWFKEDYETNRTDATNLLKLAGCDQHNLTYEMVSNLHINSLKPPTVVDSTYCIHPLDNSPFSSFRTKLATAKFLGFDPTVVAPDERLLKTMSGDITATEDWGLRLTAEYVHHQNETQSKIQHYVAAMVKLAIETNRTLVLPRHIREKKSRAYPLYSFVSTADIEAMVDWRFMSQNEALALERSTRTIAMPKDLDSAVSATQACDEKVCAIQGLTTISRRGSSFMSDPDLDDIISNLTWCFNLPGYMRDIGHFKFQESVGGFSNPCVPKGPPKPKKRKDVVIPFLGT